MSRLFQPPRTSFSDPEDLEAYDAVVQRRRAMKMAADDPAAELDAPDMGEYFGALLNSPRVVRDMREDGDIRADRRGTPG
jgi:hypothetical protein